MELAYYALRIGLGGAACCLVACLDANAPPPSDEDPRTPAVSDRPAAEASDVGSEAADAAASTSANGAPLPPQQPVPHPDDPRAFKQLALGRSHSCALRNDGHVFCWGYGSSGQLGTPVPDTTWSRGYARVVPGLEDVVAVYAGGDGTCARRANGAVLCWGSVFLSQRAEGGQYHQGNPQPEPITALGAIADIALGNDFHCARLSQGEVRCWGLNHRGQLGDDTRTGRAGAESALASHALVMQGATQIASGLEHSCAIDGASRVRCWGRDLVYPSWQESAADQLSPVSVDLADVVEVDVGQSHACARQRSGQVQCWGWGAVGQLGHGSNQASATPVLVRDLDDATDIALADNITCALKATGQVACWGENYQSILGTGTEGFQGVPVLVVGLDDAYQLDVGGAICALSRSRGLLCWASNGIAVGDGTGDTDSNQRRTHPVPVFVAE